MFFEYLQFAKKSIHKQIEKIEKKNSEKIDRNFRLPLLNLNH